MIKKFLSATLFGFLMLGLAGTFVACDDYDDSDLRRRVNALEGTLSDLQTQIANGAVITDITSSSNGLTITTSDGQTFSITNGVNGADGADGAPGSVVEIGSNGNWFIDGVDTGFPSRGAAGQDGADGKDGQDGKDGADGYVPSIEIIDGYWYIDGVNTGQAAQGEKGDKGDKGDQGEKGDKGDQGETGPQGPQGETGPQGPQGETGPQGPAGHDGTASIYINDDGYWVINGEVTDVLAQGEKGDKGDKGDQGDKGDKGDQGDTGSQGPAGQDGKDAPTIYYTPDPEGYWVKVTIPAGEITEDNPVVYEPQDGQDGRDLLEWKPVGTITAVWNTDTQYLTLYNVADEEGNYSTVTIKLSEPLVGLSFVPDAIKEGYGVTTFYSLSVEKELHNPGVFNKDYNYLASSDLVMTYRMNPNNADIANLRSASAWSFINRTVTVRSANADGEGYLEIQDVDLTSEPGKAIITATASKEDLDAIYDSEDAVLLQNQGNGKEVLVALRANDKTQSGASRIITSDYSIVDFKALYDFRVAKLHKVNEPTTNDANRYYPETWAANRVVTESDAADASFVYTESLDLNTIAEAWAIKSMHISLVKAGFEKYLTYKFTETNVKGADGTVQDRYTSINQDENGHYIMTVDQAPAEAGVEGPNRAAIGRKPVVHVEAFFNDTKIADGYIIIEVLENNKPPLDVLDVEVTAEEVGVVEYTQLPEGRSGQSLPIDWLTEYTFNWERVNDEIYSIVGVPADNFAELYDETGVVITYGENNLASADGVRVQIVPFNSDQTLTDGLINLQFNNMVFIPESAKENTDKVTIFIPSTDNTLYRDIRITITYKVVDNCNRPEFATDQYVTGSVQTVRGTLDDSGHLVMQTTLAEAFSNYLNNFGNNNHNYYFCQNPDEDPVYGVKIVPIQPFAQPGEAYVYDYRDQTIALTNELGYYGDMNEVRSVPVRLVAMRANGTNHWFDYTVEFRSPFLVSAAPQPISIPSDQPVETLDFAELVDITMINGNKVVWDGHKGGFITEVGSQYGLSASDFNISYSISGYDPQYLTIDAATGVITWKNAGSVLSQDTPVYVTVHLEVPGIVISETTIPVTLLKTTVAGE